MKRVAALKRKLRSRLVQPNSEEVEEIRMRVSESLKINK